MKRPIGLAPLPSRAGASASTGLDVGFDMVGAQTRESRGRGIERYVNGLVGTFARAGLARRTVLYFHDDLPVDSHWRDLPVDIRSSGPLEERRHGLERILEENPDGLDALVVTSPLLEPLGNPRAGLPSPGGGRVAVASLVYDLIPHLSPERHLADARRARDYNERLHVLKGFDVLLAISAATRDDLLRLLGVPPWRVAAIGSASDPSWFTPGEADRKVLESLGVVGPYILSVAGTEERKNVERLMEAVGRVSGPPPPQLVLCHAVTPRERRLLSRLAGKHGIADRLVVTGRVDDGVLRELYRGCAVAALPSHYEGFGLPLLEAMLCGAPVIGGRNSSQPEVVGPGGHLVEPGDVPALAAELQRLAFDATERSRSIARGRLHAARFRWESCAARCQEALRAAVRRRPGRPGGRRRLRVAVFSPLPPEPSGVADHAEELLGRLQEVVDVDVFHSGRRRPHATDRTPELGLYDERLFDTLDQARRYDVLVHQMGNSFHHDFVYRSLLRLGGLVFLHEINLAGLHASLAFDLGGGPSHLEKEIAFDQPEQCEQLLRDLPRMMREPGGLGRALGARGAYLARRAVRAAGRVLVSDGLAGQRLGEVYPESRGKVATLPLGATPGPLSTWERDALRRAQGLGEGDFVFGVFGIVSVTKYHLEIVDAFHSLARANPSLVLLFVGRGPDVAEVRRRVAQLSLDSRVRFVDDPDPARFRDLVHVVDVGVNVRRPPTNWESSASLLQLLAAGRPTITTDVDVFRGVPASAVERLDGGLEPTTALARAMERLHRSEARRRELGQGALRHVSDHHDWSRVTRGYLEHLREVADTGLGRRRRAVA